VTFQNPQLLVLIILLVPAAYAIWIVGNQKSQRTLKAFSEDYSGLRKRTISILAFSLIFLACLLIIAAGPQRILVSREEQQSANFVLLLDVSRSMAARLDCDAPMRLEGAKAIMREIITGIPSSAFAIAAFSEISFPLTEFSFDRQYLLEVIEEDLFVEVVPISGSDIENALLVIAEKKTGQPPVYRQAEYVVLISDGDFSEQVNQKLANVVPVLQQAKMQVISVGTGSGPALPIPTLDENRQCMDGQYERAEGKEFYTQLFEEPLRFLAEQTGGRYFSDNEQSELVEFLRTKLKNVQGLKLPVQAEDMSAPFLIIATISLFGLALTHRF